MAKGIKWRHVRCRGLGESSHESRERSQTYQEVGQRSKVHRTYAYRLGYGADAFCAL